MVKIVKIGLSRSIYTDLENIFLLSDSLPTSPQHEVITTAVAAKETAGQYHGSDEPVRTSCTDQVFSTNALLSEGKYNNF